MYEKLIEKHKDLLYKNRNTSNKIEATPFCLFGIECNIGWYKILDDLFDEIKTYCDNRKKEYPIFLQIKEKWGGLTIYHVCDEDIEEYIDYIIKQANKRSYRTCEICGNKGKLRRGSGWLVTLCNECAKNLNKED